MGGIVNVDCFYIDVFVILVYVMGALLIMVGGQLVSFIVEVLV